MKPFKAGHGNGHDKIEFLLSLIKQDMDHYEQQRNKILDWIAASKPSLNTIEAELLEELREEYQMKSSLQEEALIEFQKTLLTNHY
ncbi:hypothetical protein [Bacillus tuaregi]|uniref:hypothetical protein n=1 Tax=Bacillus tuaregi TaxID=1816695 RepID=UPI0008F822F9|nr:hypothetical protein [Bacillus tuaregi]